MTEETAQEPAIDEENIKNALEAILFAAGEAVALNVMAEALEIPNDKCRGALDELKSDYDYSRRGIRIVKLDNKYQMLTRRDYFEYIRRVLKNSGSAMLSQAALETLAIVAYKQPVARADIEYIRGVQSSSSLDLLIDRGLVRPSGKLDVPGKPTSYITTPEFLKFMNIETLTQLPEYEEFAAGIQMKLEGQPQEQIEAQEQTETV